MSSQVMGPEQLSNSYIHRVRKLCLGVSLQKLSISLSSFSSLTCFSENSLCFLFSIFSPAYPLSMFHLSWYISQSLRSFTILLCRAWCVSFCPLPHPRSLPLVCVPLVHFFVSIMYNYVLHIWGDVVHQRKTSFHKCQLPFPQLAFPHVFWPDLPAHRNPQSVLWTP